MVRIYPRSHSPMPGAFSLEPGLDRLGLCCGGRIVVLVWTYLNPRVFPAPKDQNTWASRGVLGERVFLKRRAEVAPHHLRWANALAIASLPGLVVLVLGVWQLKAEWAIFGTALTMGPKLWFVHRMGWLYADWLAEHKKELGDV